jgi:hypothetical protein
MKPTRKNMFDAMTWLVKDAKMHDSLFFHCNMTLPPITKVYSLIITSVDSGHGGQVKDETGKESDGMDEGM